MPKILGLPDKPLIDFRGATFFNPSQIVEKPCFLDHFVFCVFVNRKCGQTYYNFIPNDRAESALQNPLFGLYFYTDFYWEKVIR